MRRRWWLPSLGAALWLAFFLGPAMSEWRLVLISADGDPALHWRIGHWMIEHRQILRTEQFSHTRLGAPLISKEWLGEVLYAAAGNALGWQGIVILGSALIATTLWLLYRLLRAEGAAALLATGLVLVAALACSHHWLARPHLFTHLLTVVFVWQLRAGKAWWLPLWMVLWVNLHGAFLTGFVLIGCFIAGSVLRRDWRKAGLLAGVLAACGAASLLNPNGWRLHLHILEFLRTPVVAQFANEFGSPDFHAGGMRGFTLLLLLLGVTLLWVRPRWKPVEVVLLAVWGYLALRQVRNVPIFTLVAVPILAEHLGAWLTAPRYRQWSANVERLDAGAGGWIVALAALALIPQTDILPSRFPVAAVKFLRAQPAAVCGEMFNDYGWGGYLLLALPERRVFVDGRNDFYGGPFMEEFNRCDRAQPGWEAVCEKYRVGWTILPVQHPLNQLLALRPEWPVVYADAVAVIRARATGSRRDQSDTSAVSRRASCD